MTESVVYKIFNLLILCTEKRDDINVAIQFSAHNEFLE